MIKRRDLIALRGAFSIGIVPAPRPAKRERGKKKSGTRNHMERDAHNCARVMGRLGYLKRRPLPNDTNYAINVPRVRAPPVDDSLSQHSQPRPHVTTPACVTTLKWSASYNTASRLSLGSVARAISGSGWKEGKRRRNM